MVAVLSDVPVRLRDKPMLARGHASRPIVLRVAFVLAAATCLVSCGRNYTTQHFSFPPSSKPHEHNWELRGIVLMSDSRSGATVDRVDQQVEVRIEDQAKRIVFERTYTVKARELGAKIHWQKREFLTVELIDVADAPPRQVDVIQIQIRP